MESFEGEWEKLNNLDSKLVEFDQFRKQAGTNSFVLTPQKWIEKTSAIGIISKSGRYGGTYAHKDIALEFASWISPEFKLYIIKDYQRLKNEESNLKAIGWNVKRELAKTNYKIHTEAIKENLALSQQERLFRLNQIALFQLETLLKNSPKSLNTIKKLQQ